ncbi:transcriptional regulator, LysR family protein [Stappia aggregata IAM 12614]|uniref:Transcriptional regulator, LysR family protein n=1 Tax=Roseibium aggregatum (strain ATCC 25650 / DSM 13394 / JCM 20685 / NBRC 16684 / NCIMB 2208 / IAM 12614 / B1) TaxID=384765 RepID=A0P106_ROSAI|nr:LysR family transcriptional regulator [Roseibium aggregatum]EAV41191.1 transcriptional regulator, LysR family protein [Stappia aggregata IAM 12614] [Roseibium aggregatum IAM 12614]
MQLQAIAYFNELARCRSIREAAQNLGVSPTAISRQLENLEYHFGAPLVDRTARGIELTAAGELLVQRSRSAMREFDLARQLIDDMRGLQRGEVTVYVNGATGGAILAGVLSGFSRDFPAIRANLLEGSATEALKSVHEGDADMALTLFSPSEPKVTARSRVPVRHAAILSPAHPAAGVREVSLETLCAYPLAMPDTSFSCGRPLKSGCLLPVDRLQTWCSRRAPSPSRKSLPGKGLPSSSCRKFPSPGRSAPESWLSGPWHEMLPSTR